MRYRTLGRSGLRVADRLGVTCPQVATAWTRHRSPAVHPILGARTDDTNTMIDIDAGPA